MEVLNTGAACPVSGRATKGAHIFDDYKILDKNQKQVGIIRSCSKCGHTIRLTVSDWPFGEPTDPPREDPS